eukprot:1137005-Pelagomonas_calceolata.AAC.2
MQRLEKVNKDPCIFCAAHTPPAIVIEESMLLVLEEKRKTTKAVKHSLHQLKERGPHWCTDRMTSPPQSSDREKHTCHKYLNHPAICKIQASSSGHKRLTFSHSSRLLYSNP